MSQNSQILQNESTTEKWDMILQIYMPIYLRKISSHSSLQALCQVLRIKQIQFLLQSNKKKSNNHKSKSKTATTNSWEIKQYYWCLSHVYTDGMPQIPTIILCSKKPNSFLGVIAQGFSSSLIIGLLNKTNLKILPFNF